MKHLPDRITFKVWPPHLAALGSTLNLDEVTTVGNRNAYGNFLIQAIVAIQEGDIAEARNKLEKAISRTDGCDLRLAPDGNGPGRDWITGCTVQNLVYATLTDALSLFPSPVDLPCDIFSGPFEVWDLTPGIDFNCSLFPDVFGSELEFLEAGLPACWRDV